MQRIFTHWTTQYANTLESAIDDGDPTVPIVLEPKDPGLTYAEWFNTRRHVTVPSIHCRRETVWLVEKDRETQQDRKFVGHVSIRAADGRD